MAKQLGRWKCATSLIGTRDDAFLPAIDDPVRARTHDAAWEPVDEPEAEGNAHHVHIHLPPEYGRPQPQPARQAAPHRTHRTYDQAPPPQRPVVRRDQAAGEPQPGQLVCKLAQNGETGTWSGEDCDGRPLVVTHAGDGTIEIRHSGGEETDPDKITAPIGSTPATPGASRDFERRMAKALSPGRDIDQRNPSGLRGLSALLRSHYARRS
jgi:hypothetical protein